MKPLNINEFLERYVIVNVSISTWSARRNNTPKDLGLEDETISKDVASVGGKSVFDLKKSSSCRISGVKLSPISVWWASKSSVDGQSVGSCTRR